MLSLIRANSKKYGAYICYTSDMAYFPDLTPYKFISRLAKANEVNIGWLDSTHDFLTGQVPERVVDIIFELCKQPVNQTRGAHGCELCDTYRLGYIAVKGNEQLGLGSAEIRVKSYSGVEYACPNMIYHYIKDHQYHPPQEFIDAVLALELSQP